MFLVSSLNLLNALDTFLVSVREHISKSTWHCFWPRNLLFSERGKTGITCLIMELVTHRVVWTQYLVGLVAQSVKNHPMQETTCRDAGRDAVLIPGLVRSPGEGNGNPLQFSCLENSMNRGSWWATVHGVARVRHDLVTKLPPPFTSCSICLEPAGSVLEFKTWRVTTETHSEGMFTLAHHGTSQ